MACIIHVDFQQQKTIYHELVESCTSLGCTQRTLLRGYKGHPLCPEHYLIVLRAELSIQYSKFCIYSQPSERLRYLIARYFSEYCKLEMLEQYAITKNRIINESRNWKPGRDSLSFEIDVPFYPKNRQPSRIITLIVSFDINEYSFTFRRKK